MFQSTQLFQMQCPKCKSRLTKVVLTRDTEDKAHIIRRRVCYQCDYRWYAMQAMEVIIEAERLTWHKKRVSLSNDCPSTEAVTQETDGTP